MTTSIPSQSQKVPTPPTPQNRDQTIKDLTIEIGNVREAYGVLPPTYHQTRFVRFVALGAVILTLSIAILTSNGNLKALSDRMVDLMKNIQWLDAALASGTFIIIIGVASLLIHRTLHRNDKILNASFGKVSGDDYWVSAYYTCFGKPGLAFPGYIDTSTLDSTGSGRAYMYAEKDEGSHMMVCLTVAAVSPLYALGVIAYYTARLAFAPLYILSCILFEKASGLPIDTKERPFAFSDITVELEKSFTRICAAPFYGVALMMVSIYALSDPLNGRKLGAAIERGWNGGLSRAEGFWSVRGPQSLWQFEGGLTPDSLGKNGFFLAGCWQPIAVVVYKNGKIVSSESLTHAIDPKQGKVYTVVNEEMLRGYYHYLTGKLAAATR